MNVRMFNLNQTHESLPVKMGRIISFFGNVFNKMKVKIVYNTLICDTRAEGGSKDQKGV